MTPTLRAEIAKIQALYVIGSRSRRSRSSSSNGRIPNSYVTRRCTPRFTVGKVGRGGPPFPFPVDLCTIRNLWAGISTVVRWCHPGHVRPSN